MAHTQNNLWRSVAKVNFLKRHYEIREQLQVESLPQCCLVYQSLYLCAITQSLNCHIMTKKSFKKFTLANPLHKLI